MTTMKVVLKLDLDGDKQKQKAMEAVATLHGIDSIAVDMRVQEMTVVGSVDPADVLKKLRNSFPATDIVSVGPAKEEKKMDAIKIQDSHPPLPRGSGDHPHLITAELPSSRKTVEIPERSTEAPVCALVGVMYRLPAKLDGLLRHGHMLPKGADGEIPLIKKDLGVMTTILHYYSNSGAENCTMMIECLMKEVRELSYDIEDYIDQYEHAANFRSGSSFRIPRRKNKITHRNSKTTRLPEKLKRRLWMANKIREFSLRSQQALERCNMFDLGGTSTTSTRCDASFGSWHPTQYGERADQLVGLDVHMNTLEEWLTKDGEQTLKVASIVGFGGVGKTTLASELYRRIGGQFECRAFVRTSQKLDIRRLLISMLSQVRPNHPPDNWKVHSLIANIRTHLQDKRYLIVIDDVRAMSTWDIVNCVLLDGNCCSRILITTEIEDVALKCCGYDSKYVFMMKPLGDDDASKLFFNTAFGPQHQCPPELGEVSNSIIRKCGGLPLATVTIASLLASRMGKPEQWDYINKSLGYGLRTNPTFEGMKPILNLSYNNLPQHLKPCMLYLSIYQEDQIIWKDDLVKQWIAESFICATEEKDEEEISRSYFDELISSRMIQPVHMNDNNEVLSCTVHCMVLNFTAQKSIEDNFVTAVNHSQTSTRLADKVRRLSLHFGNAEDATTPTNMRLSQVRTLAFFGVFKCVPSIVEFPLLQVLVLHLWGDEESISFDLSRISELFRLRYLQVICNVALELQTQMRGLQYLETLKIDARVSTVPSNIVHLPALLHLSLPVETNLPNGIGRMASLRTLGYFDLSSNSIDNVLSIGELTNLQDLQLTCSTVPSDYLESKMIIMGLILAKLGNLKSLTLEPSSILDAGPSSMSISCDVWSSISSPPALLQRLEWLPQVCTFSSLPKWIGHLGKLCILKFGIRELARNDVDRLRGLPALTVLSLYVRTMPAERIIFRKGGFLVLKHFEFRCSVPCLQFEADSMPNLRKLKLGFDAHGADQHGTVPVGLEHLSGLKEICAKIGGGGANEPGSRSAKSALSDAIRMHLGRPTVNIQCVDRMFGGKDDQNSLFFDRLNRGNRRSSSRPRQRGRELSPKSSVRASPYMLRKHAQKMDKGAKHPRGYYKCVHFAEQKCMARKQVQRTDGDLELFNITYSGKHTCVLSTHSLPQPGQEQSSVSDKAVDKALDAVQWVVGKALAPVTDGLLEAWGATKNFGPRVKDLTMELLLVKATLEIASGKQLGGQAMEKLLQKLRDSAHDAEDLLDELDYFRIHDGLHGTYDTADEHSFFLNVCHTAKAVGKRLASVWSPATSPGDLRARKRMRGNSSAAPNANQADEEVSGWMPKLGKLLPRSFFPHGHDDDETQKLGFNRVDVSERIKRIVEQLQPMRTELTTILQSCGRNIVPDTSQSRTITTGQSIEAKLYGRDRMVNSIIHDITKGKHCGKDLSVLPIVGPGGIGKTTMVQHIYQNQEVQNHFQVLIWVCVSLNFNLNKLLEEIKEGIPEVKGEEKGKPEELIAQRLKSKRFLLVLDDIWECSNEDDWKRLLLPLNRSQEKGSVILVATRFEKIAQMVKTTEHSIELEGLESKEFRELFYACVFGDEQCRKDHPFLLQTGDKIMEKLKGSPLAAKTVGKLLRKNINLCHWRRVLESKEWEAQTGSNDIMPALKLSYDYLPFHLQQCFSCSALFPEDYHFRSSELINLWIGLDILQPGARKQTHEDIGLSNLNELVTHGFFRKEETYGFFREEETYVMHDLLHDLALNVASHECLSLHRSNVGSVQIQPCIRHLSIVIDDVGHDNAVSGENFKSELKKLKTKLKFEHLQTLMLFGGMDESFASILRDLFWEANALRVLHLPRVSYSVDSILYNFSTLVHLRYLCLGTEHRSQMHLPHTIFRFYHLRILDLGSWYGSSDLPKDMSNLAKLCRFYTESKELHSDICNVGKLKLLEELKVFRVNKESEGFEPKQLEHLTELRNLGIYNLEKIHTREEATEAKLIEKNYLQRLTLDWDSRRSSVEPHMEAVVLESLQPHRDLQHLCIRGHGGPSCPTWLGDELAIEALQSLHLIGVSWEVLPCFGKMWELDGLRLEHIVTMKEFVIEQSFRMLKRLTLIGLESFEKWVAGAVDLFPLLQELIIRDCPKLSELPLPNHIVYPLKQDEKIDWFPKLQKLNIERCPEFSSVTPISWIESLCSVTVRDVKLLKTFWYSKSSSDGKSLYISGKDDLHSLDQVLVFNKETDIEKLILNKCPPLELRHLLMLTSLKTLVSESCDGLVGPPGGQGDVKWQLPVECLEVQYCGATGRELTELLAHLPRLSSLTIEGGGLTGCRKITQLVVGVDVQKKTSTTSELEEDEVVAEAAAELTVEQEKEEDGVLLLPPHLSDSLRELKIKYYPELILVAPPTLLPDAHNEKIGGGGWLQALRCLQRLEIDCCTKFLSAYSLSSPCRLFPSSLQNLDLGWVMKGWWLEVDFSYLTSLTRLKLNFSYLTSPTRLVCSSSRRIFPSSLQYLELWHVEVEGKGTLEPLSNLTSLTVLKMRWCGEDLRCEGLLPLLTTGGHLSELIVKGSPKFFVDWDPRSEGLQVQGGGQEHQLQLVSKLRELSIDDAAGLLAVPICSFLSSSLTKLWLESLEMERFSKEQEDALHLLASLQELTFESCFQLQHLPAGLHKLTNLNKLEICECPAVRSLPNDGLPKSLQELDVSCCDNEELTQQCRGLVGTIPIISV